MDYEHDIQSIVKAYGIKLAEVLNKHPNKFDLRVGNQRVVLHKTSMEEAQVTMWESVFHRANDHKIDSILPVYPTIRGDLFVMRKNNMFYLTPYIETEQTKSIPHIFQTIAKIHQKTKQTFIIQKQNVMDAFKQYKEAMKSSQMYLRQTIDLFEQQPYMSPIELQVCSHFHVVEDAFGLSMEHVNALLAIGEKNEKQHMEWSSSLCHKRLSTKHVLEKQVQYITNWEAASLANGTEDIVEFCRNEFVRNEYPLADFIEGLTIYNDLYTLNNVEEHILAIHLLHPLTYIETLREYVSKRGEMSVISSVIELERIFRVISNSYHLLLAFEQRKPNLFAEEND